MCVCVRVRSCTCARVFPELKPIPIVSYILLYYFPKAGPCLLKFHFPGGGETPGKWSACQLLNNFLLPVSTHTTPFPNEPLTSPCSDKARRNQTDAMNSLRGGDSAKQRQKWESGRDPDTMPSSDTHVALRLCSPPQRLTGSRGGVGGAQPVVKKERQRKKTTPTFSAFFGSIVPPIESMK